MKKKDINTEAFFSLLRAGLWADDESTGLRNYGYMDSVDWENVYQLSEEQSVIGVLLAGIEHSNVKPPQELLLQWIGEVQMQEQQNKEMNQFIAELIEKMRNAGIYTLLIKGQGVAQCYERPLWRACGDVDLLLSEDNYQKSVKFLTPLATTVESEYKYNKHLGMTINPWVVELHGSLRSELSSRVDKVLDEIKGDIFLGGNVRSWLNGRTQVFLPSVDGDVVYIFTHILQHFYKGGIGLRQICDWSRLIWTYKDSLNHGLLEKRIRMMGLMSEWKAFAALAVDWLGMPAEAMPLYDSSYKWKRKADRIMVFVIEVGNFGVNRDSSYYNTKPYIIRKFISLKKRFRDVLHHATIFPLDSVRFFTHLAYVGLLAAARGE